MTFQKLIPRRREVLERRIEYLESNIPKNEYSGIGTSYMKQELSALKCALLEIDYLRAQLEKVMEHI